MLRPQQDIYVTLPSNVPGVPGNKPSNYKTVLPRPLKLNGAWVVALLEIHYPPQIPNFNATTLVLISTEDTQSEMQQHDKSKQQHEQRQLYWLQRDLTAPQHKPVAVRKKSTQADMNDEQPFDAGDPESSTKEKHAAAKTADEK